MTIHSEGHKTYDGGMLDITAPDYVEIVIKEDGKVVWINTGGCVFRACRIGQLVIEDRRTTP